MSGQRYAIWDSCPNNAIQRCWGVYDLEEDDYVTLADGTFCWGMLQGEAEKALASLSLPASKENPMVEFEGAKVLRCQSCGAEIGRYYGEDPSYWGDKVVLRCYLCAATEEAEAITREAADDA